MIETALKYRSMGLSVIKLNGKIPIDLWGEYQTRQATEEELQKWYFYGGHSIGIVTGYSDLEVIDVDTKQDKTGTLWQDLWEMIIDLFDGQPPFTPVRTPSGGAHIYYRCETIEGNQELAKNKAGRATIETRGIGGYVAAPPTKGYAVMNDMELSIPTLKEWQRDELISLCRTFTLFIADERVEDTKPKSVSGSGKLSFKTTPWDAYNDADDEPWRDVLEKHGWEIHRESRDREYWKRRSESKHAHANWHVDKELFYVFTPNTPFASGKAYTPYAIYTVLEHGGDYTASTKKLIAEGYGERYSDEERAALDNYIKARITGDTIDMSDPASVAPLLSLKSIREEMGITQGQVAEIVGVSQPMVAKVETGARALPSEWVDKLRSEKNYPVSIEPDTAIMDIGDQYIEDMYGIYWTQKIVKKRLTTVIDNKSLLDYLKKNGYARLRYTREDLDYDYVHIDKEKHLMYRIGDGSGDSHRVYIKSKLREHIEQMDFSGKDTYHEEVYNLLINYPESKFNQVLSHLDDMYVEDLNMMRDTSETAYIPYLNAIAKITADKTELLDYADLDEDTVIWADMVLDRDIQIIEQESEEGRNKLSFYKFIKRLSNIHQMGVQVDLLEDVDARNNYYTLISHLGYMLHNYRDKSKPWVVMIQENTITPEEGGGTGKSLLGEAVSKIRKTSIVNGQQWERQNKFRWQSVDPKSYVIRLEDIKARFNFGEIYNDITDKMEIEKKNKQPIQIPYERLPKIMTTSNYAQSQDGAHFERRIKQVLITPYYNSKRTPHMDLGEQFFGKDWDDQKWLLFDNYMMTILQWYLKNDVVSNQDSRLLDEKMIVQLIPIYEMQGEIYKYHKEHLQDMIDRGKEARKKGYKYGKSWEDIHNEIRTHFGLSERDYTNYRMKQVYKRLMHILSVEAVEFIQTSGPNGTGLEKQLEFRYKTEEDEVVEEEIQEEMPF